MVRAFHFRDDVHPVIVGDDLVVLDVTGDRYLCLADAAAQGELSAARDRMLVRSDGLEADLTAAGVGAVGGSSASGRPALPPRAERSALKDGYRPPQLGDLVPAAHALVDAAWRYRRQSFSRLVSTGRSKRPPARITPRLLSAVDRHHRWSPYLPVTGKCLLQSFLLLRALRRQGLDATWVFGVRTWPFHAHCWLQCEDMALNDTAERTWAYTPIMTA